MSKQIKHFYEFGEFRIDTVNRQLLQKGEIVPLKAKAVETLLILMESRGDVVEKDYLMNKLWADSFVEESNLTQNIYTLRKAFGEDQYIETIPRRGYRFKGDVKEWTEEADSADELILVKEKTRMSISYETEDETEPAIVRPALIGHRISLVSLAWILAIGLIIVFAALFLSLRTGRIPFENAKLAKLTTTGNVWKCSISPDGKYLAFVVNEPNQQSLWLRQVATGKDLKLQAPAQTQFYGLTFSHDGNYLYYTSRESNHPGNLYRVATLGGEPIRFSEDVDSPVGLAFDDKQLAFFRFSSHGRTLVVANADGTQERNLATSGQSDTFVLAPAWDVPPPAWSPDGKTIACAVGIPMDKGKYETLWGFDTNSGASRPLTSQHWEEVGRPEWLADGSGLIAAAAGQGTGFVYQIWHIGFPSGTARKITNDLSDYRDLSLTADGKTVVAVQAERKSNLSIAMSNDIGNSKQITFANFDGINGLAWTLEYKVVYTHLVPGGQNLWILDPDNGEPRELTANQGFIIHPVVSPDGRFIVFAANRDGLGHIWRVDIDGRNPLELSNGLDDIQPAVTGDSQWVFFKASGGELFRVGINGGEPERMQKGAMPAVSPDGTLIAFNYRPEPSIPAQWAVISVEGGDPRLICNLPVFNVRFVWTPDGRGLTYAPTNDQAGGIWVQPLDGSRPHQLFSGKSERIFSFGWSRDGKKLAFGSGSQTSDVVRIGETDN